MAALLAIVTVSVALLTSSEIFKLIGTEVRTVSVCVLAEKPVAEAVIW